MKTIMEWVSCQLFSRSLLSARPLGFVNEDSARGEHENRGTPVDSSSSYPVSHSASFDHENVSHSQFSTSEIAFPYHPNSISQSKENPLAEVEAIQITFLRLLQRIGVSLDNQVVSRVLYRLQLASLIRGSISHVKRSILKVDDARIIAAEKETSNGVVDFSIKILVLGKTGVGKSATINSIFDQKKTETCAFQPATDQIQEIVGSIKGIKVRFIDTPGLLPSYTNQRHNRKILLSVKRYIQKCTPDIVLYFDRLDFIYRDFDDFPLLKLITDIFSSSIWFNTTIVLTHASSAVPEGFDGHHLKYEAFVTRCTNMIQRYVKHAVSDDQLECPFLLVENHPLCKTNMSGEKILPNGIAWRCQFLLLCISNKILADVSSLLKFQDKLQSGQVGSRLPSLPHILSTLLHRHSLTGVTDLNNEIGCFSAFDEDDDDDYDNLPPIRVLSKAEFQELPAAQKNDYLNELDFRETLYLKKQWKLDLRRHKSRTEFFEGLSETEHNDENVATPDAVPSPDIDIPLSFDSDYPVYRYRCIMNDDRWLARPVLDSHGWDHDVGLDGINLESSIDLTKNLHASIIGQMSKEKDELTLQTECMVRYMDPFGSLLSSDINVQTAGKDLISTVRGDASFQNLKYNTTGCGLSLTSFRHMYFPGANLKDYIAVGKRYRLGINMGCVGSRGQMAYGGGLESTIRGKHYPVRDEKTTLAASLICFENEIVFGGSIHSDFRVGRGTKMSVDANLNSRKLGQISMKTSTTEHFEIAFLALVTAAGGLFKKVNQQSATTS